MDKRDRIKSIIEAKIENNIQNKEVSADVEKVENVSEVTVKVEYNEAEKEQVSNYTEENKNVNIAPKKKSRVWSVIISTALACVAIFGVMAYNNGWFGLNMKEYEIGGGEIKITLKGDVEKKGFLGTDLNGDNLGVTLSNKNLMVQIFKWRNSEFDGYVLPTITEFAAICGENPMYYSQNNWYCTGEKNVQTELYGKNFYYKTKNAFYEVEFTYYQKAKNEMNKAVNTLKFADELIFDIIPNGDVVNSKKVSLGVDSAEISIQKNLIQDATDNTSWSSLKISTNGRPSAGAACLFYFETELKSTSEYATITEYAESWGYPITTTLEYKKVSAVYGGNYYYLYFYETDNYYIVINFISEVSANYDTYANTFTTN